uniref:6-phosphogluconolactonase n=1 Tax=Glossina morsitans morsitans TaxID=37546 RepID=A0A1B0G7U8_GLOMM
MDSLTIIESKDELVTKLKEEIEKRAKDAIEDHNEFRIGLSGGSLVQYVSDVMSCAVTGVENWKIFFCDERFVEESQRDSTYGCYKRALPDGQTFLKEEQFVKIDTKLSLDDCARDYERRILKEFNCSDNQMPKFDLLILGMGPDGHTCSLFPEHSLLKETKRLIAAIDDSPKPPSQRITMTLPLINNASCCLFVITGESKAAAVKQIFSESSDTPFPVQLVKPVKGDLLWIVDTSAAKVIKK